MVHILHKVYFRFERPPVVLNVDLEEGQKLERDPDSSGTRGRQVKDQLQVGAGHVGVQHLHNLFRPALRVCPVLPGSAAVGDGLAQNSIAVPVL